MKKPTAAKEAKPDQLGPGECNAETAAKLIMITVQWFNTLVRQGWIKKAGKGRYKVVDVVQGHIRYLKDENARATKSASASRVQDARAGHIEMMTQRELGKLVEIESEIAYQSDILGTLRNELIGVPAAVTRDLEMRRLVEDGINGAVERARVKFEERAGLLRSGRAIDVEPEEGDA
jgi:hypothetical protein